MPTCEKHFHDYDETWLILAGRGTAYLIDHDGVREDLALEAGDVLVIPAGFEHGSEGPNTFAMNAVLGTLAPGAHTPGHYYVEEAGYVPSLSVVRTPSKRYPSGTRFPRDPVAQGTGLEGLPVLVIGNMAAAAQIPLTAALTAVGARPHVTSAVPATHSVSSDFAALALLPGATLPGSAIRAFFAAGKPVAALASGVRALLDGDVLSGRTVSAPAELRTDLASAGAVIANIDVCTDTGLVTAGVSRAEPAWTVKVLEVFAEGAHPSQRRSVEAGK